MFNNGSNKVAYRCKRSTIQITKYEPKTNGHKTISLSLSCFLHKSAYVRIKHTLCTIQAKYQSQCGTKVCTVQFHCFASRHCCSLLFVEFSWLRPHIQLPPASKRAKTALNYVPWTFETIFGFIETLNANTCTSTFWTNTHTHIHARKKKLTNNTNRMYFSNSRIYSTCAVFLHFDVDLLYFFRAWYCFTVEECV